MFVRLFHFDYKTLTTIGGFSSLNSPLRIFDLLVDYLAAAHIFFRISITAMQNLRRLLSGVKMKFRETISKGFFVTVHTENKAFLCHCEAFRPKQSQKRTILDCFASLAMTKMRFSRERLRCL